MGVNSTKTHLFDGDRKNRKQGIRIIPAKAEANKPGILGLQYVTGAVVSDKFLFINDTGTSLMMMDTVPTVSGSQGTAVGGVANLDEAFDATSKGIIDGATGAGTGTSLRVGGSGSNKIEFYHNAANAYISSLVGDLYLAAAGDDINFSSDNIAGVTNLTIGGTFSDGVASISGGAITATTYNGLTITAGSDAISLTEGTATIAVGAAAAFNLGAGAQVVFTGTADFDQATGTTVTIASDFSIAASTALTVSGGGAIALNQSLATGDAPAFATGVDIGDLTLADGSIVSSGGTIDFNDEILTTTSNIDINSNSNRLTMGTSGAGSSYIRFDGSTMLLYDTTSGPWTLEQLATGTTLNPSVTGNLTVGAGYFQCDNTANALSYIKRNNATGDGPVFEIEESNASGGVAFLVDSDNEGADDAMQITYEGTAYGLDIVTVAATSGALYCAGGVGTERMVHFDGTAGSWVGKGDEGMVEIDSNGVLIAGANLLRVSSAANNGAASFLVEIEASGTFAGATDGTCLRVVDSGSAAATSYAQYISSTNNSGLKIVTAATGQTNLVCVGPASQTTPIVLIDGSTGPWVGVAGSGMLELTSGGVLAATTTNLLRIEYSGAAGSQDVLGTCLAIMDSGTNAQESYAAYISSTNNNGLQIATGAVGDINLLLTGSTAGVDHMFEVDGSTGNWVGSGDLGCVDIHSDAVLVAGSNLLRVHHASGAPATESHLVEIVGAGAWAGATLGTCLNITDTGAAAAISYAVYINSTNNSALNLVTGATGASNLVMTGLEAQTASMVVIDGSTDTGWDGANGVGCLHINTLVQNSTGATALYVDHAAQPIASGLGVAARFVQSSGDARPGSFLVEIGAITTGGALHVDSGYAVFDESVTVAGGYLTTDTTVTTSNVDGAVNHLAAALLGGLILRGVNDGLTSNQTDTTDNAVNIVAAIPGAVVGSSFEFSIQVVDTDFGIILDGNTGVTMLPADPTLLIPAKSTGRFLAVCTNVTGTSEAVTVYFLGHSVSSA